MDFWHKFVTQRSQISAIAHKAGQRNLLNKLVFACVGLRWFAHLPDLKSAVRKDVPVRVRPRAPMTVCDPKADVKYIPELTSTCAWKSLIVAKGQSVGSLCVHFLLEIVMRSCR